MYKEQYEVDRNGIYACFFKLISQKQRLDDRLYKAKLPGISESWKHTYWDGLVFIVLQQPPLLERLTPPLHPTFTKFSVKIFVDLLLNALYFPIIKFIVFNLQ